MLDMPRTPLGLADGTNAAKILAGTAGPLSEVVRKEDPNLVYGFSFNDFEAAVLMDLGFEFIIDFASADILLKRKQESES